jgi:mRNA interferase MazF
VVRRPGPARRDPVPTPVVRGEVWLVALDPTVGGEIQRTRPCVIVSPPELHDHLRTVFAAPMTTASRPTPFRVPLRFEGKDGLILLDQIRALDRRRLVKRLGAIDRRTLRATLATLQDVFVE